MTQSVPSPIDLRTIADATAWERDASLRPGRAEMLDRFPAELRNCERLDRVLELGSGPGFLAAKIREAFPDVSYVALDFSPAMHALARTRLGPMAAQVRWVERDFRSPNWMDGLGLFSAIVTNQAVHELRHKRLASEFHARVSSLLEDRGIYLVCDHWCGAGGMANSDLFMTVEEQRSALSDGGFASVELRAQTGTLAFFRAMKSRDA